MTNKVKEKLNKLIKENEMSEKELEEALKEVSDPWMEAKGLLKGKGIPPVEYQKRVRQERIQT